MNIFKRLAEERKSREIPVAEVAKCALISKRSVYNYESGYRDVPLWVAIRYADMLDYEIKITLK